MARAAVAACGTRSGYDRHRDRGEDPCPACREACALYMREWRARQPRRPCDICRRVHVGRCIPTDARSVRLCITLPGRIGRRLHRLVPWGDRSRFIAAAVAEALDHLETEERAA